MKQAYIATKDKAEHSVNAKENTAEEYAADKTEAGIDEIAHKGAYALIKQGEKVFRKQRRISNLLKTAFNASNSREPKINKRSESARKNYNGWQFFSADADIIGNQNA